MVIVSIFQDLPKQDKCLKKKKILSARQNFDFGKMENK